MGEGEYCTINLSKINILIRYIRFLGKLRDHYGLGPDTITDFNPSCRNPKTGVFICSMLALSSDKDPGEHHIYCKGLISGSNRL